MGSTGEGGLVSVEEIQKHDSAEDCWIVVDGHVWDITEFAPEHPGGAGSELPFFNLRLRQDRWCICL